MTGFPKNEYMYATKTSALKHSSTNESTYEGKKSIIVPSSEVDSVMNCHDQNNIASMYSSGETIRSNETMDSLVCRNEWNINLNNNSYMNYNIDNHINIPTDEHLMQRKERNFNIEEVKENFRDRYNRLQVAHKHTQRLSLDQRNTTM